MSEKAKKGFKLNPKHKGWCTPITKSTCTGKRKTFALNAKRHFKKRKAEEGDSIYPPENQMQNSLQQFGQWAANNPGGHSTPDMNPALQPINTNNDQSNTLQTGSQDAKKPNRFSRLKQNLGNPSIDISNLIAGTLQGVAGLLPYQQPKDNQQPLLESYNPFPHGTNSHSAFKNGGKLKKRKAKGGDNIPTQQDSLEVYNNAKQVENYYKSSKYKKTGDKPLPTDSNFLNNVLQLGTQEFDNNNRHGMISYPGVNGKKTTGKLPEEIYTKNIDKNKVKQREYSSAILDTRSPMQLFDKRIAPQRFKEYENTNSKDELYGDEVQLFQYDPVAVKPKAMLTNAERKEFESKYGKLPPKGSKKQPKTFEPKGTGDFTVAGDVPDSSRNHWFPTQELANQYAGTLPKHKYGGKLKKRKADNGIELTDEDRNNWENMQSDAQEHNYFGNDHNRQVGADFMQEHGVDPNKLGAYQQDFLNLQNTGRVHAGQDGYSKSDNFYGHRTAKERYMHYATEHYDKHGNLIADDSRNFGTNQGAAVQQSNINQGLVPRVSNRQFPTPVQNNPNYSTNSTSNQTNINQPATKSETGSQKPDVSKFIENRKKREAETKSGSKKYDHLYMEFGGAVPGQNGLQVDDNQYEHLSPKTIEVKGNTHENGGTDVQFGNKTIEAEKGETMHYDDRDGSSVVMGNMTIPGTSMKFKQAGKLIANKEKKVFKMADKGSKLLNEKDPTNKFTNPGFNTGSVLHDAYIQNSKTIGEAKNMLTDMQNNLLEISDYMGKDPKDISKMFKGKAKFGIKLKAKWGADFDYDPDEQNVNPSIERDSDRSQSIYDRDDHIVRQHGRAKYTHPRNKPSFGNKSWENIQPHFNPSNEEGDANYTPNLNPDEVTITGQREHDQYLPINGPHEMQIDPSHNVPGGPNPDYDYVSPDKYMNHQDTVNVPDNPAIQYGETDTKQNKPSRLRDRVHFSDILPELSELFDQPQPVVRQQYNPELYSPYKVSLEDQIAGNQGDFNAVVKANMHNPAALGALSAQRYKSNNAVRGEEFRLNQGISNDIINKNVDLENKAKMTNLQLADEQYVRQNEAYENTRSNRLGAMNSLSNKYAMARKENNDMRIEEARYHYYLDKNGNPVYNGPIREYNAPTVGIDSPYSEKEKERKYPNDPEKDYIEKDNKAMGGSFGGHGFGGGRMAFRGGMDNTSASSDYKKKKRKNIKSTKLKYEK